VSPGATNVSAAEIAPNRAPGHWAPAPGEAHGSGFALFALKAVEHVRNDRYRFASTALSEEGTYSMAVHLTPTELAREAGLDRRSVITKCMELGVPIFDGRIDKTLFLASMRQHTAQSAAQQQAASA